MTSREETDFVGAKGGDCACLFTFGFPIYVDTAEHYGCMEEQTPDALVRVYPLFRSGDANFIPAPSVNPRAIPSCHQAWSVALPASCFPSLAGIPYFQGEPAGAALLASGPDWSRTLPRFFPMDSLRIDLLDASAPAPSLADAFATRLLKWLRVLTRQWWIERNLPTGAEHYLRHVVAIGRLGDFRSHPEHYGSFVSIGDDEKPVNAAFLSEAMRRAVVSEPVPLYEETYADARYHLALGDDRRAVVDAAIACEQTRDFVFDHLVMRAHGRPLRPGKDLKGNDMRNHLDRDLKTVAGVSLKEQQPAIYAQIETLWKARNRIAHGRDASLQRTDTLALVKGARECIDWLAAGIPGTGY